MKEFKCIITHDIKTVTTDELLGLISYLKSGAAIVGKSDEIICDKNIIVQVQNVNEPSDMRLFTEVKVALSSGGPDIECTLDDFTDDFIMKGGCALLIDSNEIPMVRALLDLPKLIERGDSIVVPMIHMKYKDVTLTEFGQQFKYKKFFDQSNIFHTIEEPIEIRLRSHYNGMVPLIPLSSKWVDWPKPKVFLATNSTQTINAATMYYAVFKFERVVGE